MTKRILTLDDDELEIVLRWYHLAFGDDDVFKEDEDEDVATKIREALLP